MHKIAAMIKVDPKQASVEIIAAFKKAQCHYQWTATILECQTASINRWARLLGIKVELDEIERKAEKEGWHHGRKGGATFHQDPEKRNRAMSRAWRRRQAGGRSQRAAST